MKRAIFIILAACLVVGILATTLFYMPGPPADTSAPQAAVSGSEAGQIVVWNKNRDQKVFETTDSAVLKAVAELMNNASWSSGPEPLPSLEGTPYILAVYDKDGQSTQYTMYYKSNNDITLFKTGGDERSYQKADFPAQSGGLYTYLNIGGAS
jgi:hypothetical protein